MSGIKKLAGQTAVYGVSSIVARLLNYLLVPYFTYTFTTAEYGVITDMYAIIPFLMVLLTMGLETGYFRFAALAPSDAARRRVFSSTWGVTSLAALGFLALALLFHMPAATAMGYGDRPCLFLLMAGIVTLDVISAIPFARLRQQGRAVRFVSVRIASVVVNLALCLFFYEAMPKVPVFDTLSNHEFGAGYYMVANLVASFFALALVFPRDLHIFRAGIDRRLLGSILLYSFPLLLSGIAGTANEFIDRQMIKFLMPEQSAMSSLGIYGAVIKIGVVMMLFTQMYRMAAEPFFLAEFKKEDFLKINAQAMKYFVIVSVLIFLGLTLFADLFALIIGPAFREGMYILPIVLVGNVLSGVVLNLSFWYKQSGRTSMAIVITGTGLIFTMGMGFWLVPRLGFLGAALARTTCEAAMVVISYILMRRYFPVPYQGRRIWEYVAAGLALYAAGYFTAQLPAVAHYAANAALVALFALYVMRRERIDLPGLLHALKR